MTDWISVKDRLPKNNSVVLYVDQLGAMFVARFYDGKFYDGYRLLRDPYHWMPLPEPPKEASHD